MFVDIHVQQTVPPSNLNRDDTGSPKSAIYGGVRRARVSSQAWKRATRAEFAERLQAGDLGFRTKRVIDLVVAEAGARGTDVSRDELAKRAEAALNAIGLKTEKAKDKAGTQEYLPVTQYLVLYSRGQIEALTDVILRDPKPSKKDVQAALGSTHGVEVALFGRMVADNKELSVDASVQVAHALSTHAVDDESDYSPPLTTLGAMTTPVRACLGRSSSTRPLCIATRRSTWRASTRTFTRPTTPPARSRPSSGTSRCRCQRGSRTPSPTTHSLTG